MLLKHIINKLVFPTQIQNKFANFGVYWFDGAQGKPETNWF